MKALTMFTMERIILPLYLPKSGSLKVATICESIRNKVRISLEEVTEYGIKVSKGNKITFNQKKDKGVEVDFTPDEVSLLVDTYIRMDQEGTFPTNPQFMKFYNEFKEIYEVSVS
jgi:hypothetical protein